MVAPRPTLGVLAVIGISLVVAISFAASAYSFATTAGRGSSAPFPADSPASAVSSGLSGNVTFGASTTLTSDLFASNVTIDPGVVLDTSGFSIVVTGIFDNQGTVVTGPSIVEAYPDSAGGSGGGAQSLNYCPYDEDGSSTLAVGGVFSCSNSQNGGAGSSPPAPSLTSSEIASWYAAGIQNYLAGGAGGGIDGYIAPGPGANGLYLQAQSVVAGTIDATGGGGEGPCSGIGLSGGGGGGAVLIAYNGSVQSTVNVDVQGGEGAISCSGQVSSGAGGSGQIMTFQYGSVPPVPSSPSPSGNVVIRGSQNLTGDLYASTLTIEPGAVLTTNGFSIIVSGNLTNEGSIVTGYAPVGALPDSLGGSGGGAQSLNYCSDDENGSSTLAPGGSLSCSNSVNGAVGTSPEAPSLSGSTLASWFAAGMQNYLAGGSGGAVQGYIPAGAGANGLYIQAGAIVPGSIDAAGGNGQGTCSGIGLSGGGGGGAVVLAYGTGVYGTLDLTATGGAAAPSCDGDVASGAGGNGQLILVSYGADPPVPTNSNAPGTHGSGSVPPTMLASFSGQTAFALALLAVAVGGIGLGVYSARRPRRDRRK
jgi:hypothetical protein